MEKLTHETNETPAYIKMYEISGHDKPSPRSLLRYERDKVRDDEKIKAAVSAAPSSVQKKIYFAPLGERVQLIKDGLAHENSDVQKAAAEMIYHAPEEEQARLIEQGLAHENPNVQKAAAEMIYNAPKEEQARLIEQGLAHKNVKVQKVAAEMIEKVSEAEQERLREGISELVERGFVDDDVEVQKVAAEMSWYAPRPEWVRLRGKIPKLIERGLAHEDVEIQKAAARMIKHVPEIKMERSFTQAVAVLGNALVEPPLYEKQDVSKEKFTRKAFAKTGSETTLVGGLLKGKTIIRHVTPEAFVAWQTLYENYAMWKTAGFDYVPIEPIYSFSLNKKGLVDVHSGVLDLSLRSWNDMTDRFYSELYRDRERIMEVLNKNGIQHRHAHKNNFCLRFFRDEKGVVDFNKKPRLYLIDFDSAVSSGGM